MGGRNYYLLSVLPSLGELGSVPPLSTAELLEKSTACSSQVAGQLRMLFLSSDLLQREAYLAGEIEELDLLYLTEEQAQNEAPLPLFLVPDGAGQDSTGDKSAVDRIWEAYYRETLRVTGRESFLSLWVGAEVALRNTLAEARAKALDLDPGEWMVAPDLASDYVDFTRVVNEWRSAQSPVEGLRVLDAARWEWICENDGWFTFTDDEVVAYGAKLMLLQRWHTLAKKQAERESETSTENTENKSLKD